MKLKFLISVILLLSNSSVFAQLVDTAWVRKYDGPGNALDVATDIAVDYLGNVYVTGSSNQNPSGSANPNSDYATIKYYSNGDIDWIRRYNGPRNSSDRPSALTVDGWGNAYVTGFSSDIGLDYATIKYDSNGNRIWLRRYNGPANSRDEAKAIALDDSGNIYVTGCSEGDESKNDYLTIKYYPNGDTAWIRRYNSAGNGDDQACALAVDASNYVYVTGYSDQDTSSMLDYDYLTIKYDMEGNELWVRGYNGPTNSNDRALAIAVGNSGTVYVTGYSWGIETNYDYVTIKYYCIGDTAWVRRYNGPGNNKDQPCAIAVDGSNNIYVTGTSIASGTSPDYATVKYDMFGNELWVRRYNGPSGDYDEAYAITVDIYSNVYVTGKSRGDYTTQYDYATIRYDSSGNEIWVKRYRESAYGDDYAYDVAVDFSGNVYVTGAGYQSPYPFEYYDFATIKYMQKQTFVEEEKDQTIVQSFVLQQNYPNPFNSQTKIQYYLPNATLVHLTIYNILGQKVIVLVDGFQIAGTKSVTWDGKDSQGRTVANGIYFYKLETSNYIECKKMLLLK